MSASRKHHLPADQVLVTVGTVCGVSGVGTVETQRALVSGDRSMIGFAAYDAGLVDVDPQATSPRFLARQGTRAGQVIEVEEIEERWGAALRAGMGIRVLDPQRHPSHLPADLGAPLAHDLEQGGLRRLAGLTYEQVRHSAFRDMFGLFQDAAELGPSLQSQLFLFGGLGALAALPRPLSELVPQAHRFRVSAACAFAGQEHIQHLARSMQPGSPGLQDGSADRLAFRLSTSLNTHGPALINAMLSPAYNLSKVRKNPELLDGLLSAGSPLRNVPQAPMVLSGACASALLALADVAPQMLNSAYPGSHAPHLVLWTAADAGLLPDARILEGFGAGALMSRAKLAAMNANRPAHQARAMQHALAPFDQDALGTVIGNAGSGLVLTNLQFAVENFLDITSIVVGWGQSGESGGKGHFAGVGFGGENALMLALSMAQLGHGYGVADFGHLVAHATGTRVNSRTDLTTVDRARQVLATGQGARTPLPKMTVGTPKALGDGHTLGEAGLRATAEAIYYVLGEPTVGIPSLQQLDPELNDMLDHFTITAAPVAGNADGGALAYAQGFGGYDAALALRSAHADALARYRFADDRQLDAYLERRSELRQQRESQERAARRSRGSVLALAERHRWRAPNG
jgi:3-oxoacyl-[acyl-carrier-protein] synthase II